MTSIDGVLYYLPEGATPACGSSGSGTLGICYMGLLREINLASSSPPFVLSSSTRASTYWNAGCFVRYQRPGATARANVGSHEFGHYLGMGHAGTTHYGAAHCGVIHYGTTYYGVTYYGTSYHGTTHYGIAPCGTTHYGSVGGSS